VGRRRYNRAVSRIYTLRDADAIVPDIAVVVQRLRDLRDEVIALRDATRLREAVLEADFGLAPGKPGQGTAPAADQAKQAADVGEAADHDAELLRLRLRTRGLVDQMQAEAAWLDERDIVLRDISTGLLDFPAVDRGRPIWLCWRLGEGSITAWHLQDEGFAGRRPIHELS